MSTFDPHLVEQLDLLVPKTAIAGDWQAVVSGAKRRRQRRRLVLLVTASAIVAAGIAFVGVASAVHWIFAGPADFKPAPGTKATLHAETFVGGKEWGVLSFTNSEGKLCLGIKTPGGQGLSCTTEGALFSEGSLAIEAGWTSEGGMPAAFVWGITQPQAKTVSLLFSDCSERSVAVDGDGFFLFVTPGPLDQPRPQRVTAFNDAGQIIGSKAVPSAPRTSRACATP
jgi:hypothetical protein